MFGQQTAPTSDEVHPVSPQSRDCGDQWEPINRINRMEVGTEHRVTVGMLNLHLIGAQMLV